MKLIDASEIKRELVTGFGQKRYRWRRKLYQRHGKLMKELKKLIKKYRGFSKLSEKFQLGWIAEYHAEESESNDS